MQFKKVKSNEFNDFIESLDEFVTSIYCEGNNNQSAGGIAYLVNGEQVAAATVIGKIHEYYIKEGK